MFLSRATIRDRNVLRRLAGVPYAVHQLVWSLFADAPDRRRDFLFREMEQPGLPSFLILSARMPQQPSGWCIDAKPFAPQLEAGDRLTFSLRANPVVRRNDDAGRKVRHDVVMDAKRHSRDAGEFEPRQLLIHEAGRVWLLGRQDALGVRFDEATLRVDGYQVRRFKKSEGTMAIHLATLEFIGSLTVADPELLLNRVCQGIGPGKAFGCGLMLLRRG
jgi:CRISPR system Cascade subunit CasE